MAISVEEYQKMTLEDKNKFIEEINNSIPHKHSSHPHYTIHQPKRNYAGAIILNYHQPDPGRLLTVELLKRTDINNNKTYILCKCDCGNWHICRSDAFKKNSSNGGCFSCGCYNQESLNKNIFNPQIQEKRVANLKKYLDNKGVQAGDIINGWKITQTCFKQLNSEYRRKYIKGICPYCFKESHWIRADGLLSNTVHSCGCASESIGEQTIRNILTNNNIEFKQEYIFPTCVSPETGKLYRWDFYVNNSYLIEYDGLQHFQPCENFVNEEQFQKGQKRDFYKNQWCKDNNITLIRIPYSQLKYITLNDLLPETSQFIYYKRGDKSE